MLPATEATKLKPKPTTTKSRTLPPPPPPHPGLDPACGGGRGWDGCSTSDCFLTPSVLGLPYSPIPAEWQCGQSTTHIPPPKWLCPVAEWTQDSITLHTTKEAARVFVCCFEWGYPALVSREASADDLQCALWECLRKKLINKSFHSLC